MYVTRRCAGLSILGVDATRFLAAYDEHLRTEAEVRGAVATARMGPLWLALFPDGEGFVSYRDLAGSDAAGVRLMVADALQHFALEPSVRRVEWKTRGHDEAPGLYAALAEHGFMAEEPESIMIGELRNLAVDVVLPAGVGVRRVTAEPDVRAVSALQDMVFGGEVSEATADALVQRVKEDDQLELWAAEVGGEFVSAGRLELVPGTPFAGLWGGATRADWRGRGIYRAVTATRARSALERGKTLVNSDSTEFSRPILERSGLVKVGTTTPYVWRR